MNEVVPSAAVTRFTNLVVTPVDGVDGTEGHVTALDKSLVSVKDVRYVLVSTPYAPVPVLVNIPVLVPEKSPSRIAVPKPIAVIASDWVAAVITPSIGADIADAPPASLIFLPSIKLFAPLAPISCSLAKVTALFVILAVATEVRYVLVSKLEVRFPLPSAVNLIKALLLSLGTPAKSPNISAALLAVRAATGGEALSVVIFRYLV